MKNYFILLVFAVIFSTACTPKNNAANNPQQVLHGFVKSEGLGVAGVLISDGVNFAKTESDGSYTLYHDKNQEYIFYTLPSGYNSPTNGGIPSFYKKIENGVDTYNFDLAKASLSQDKHAFVVWADPQVIDPKEFKLLDKVVDDINETKKAYEGVPLHAISCGDIVFDRLNLFDGYKEVVEKVGLPFYQSIGNHDMNYSHITNETSAETYEDNFGPAYYSFNKGKVHYIVLDDVFYYGYKYHYMGYLDQRQLNWMKEDLSYVEKGSTVIITVHIPTKYQGEKKRPTLTKLQKSSMMNNETFYESLSGYNVHILAGHSHRQWNTVINDSILEHTHAAASGAWWQGEICTDGTPNGYTVYEVDGDSLTWYFKGVGYGKDFQFKAHPIGSDIDNPSSFVVNVFNYDPTWKVVWYEDDVLQGDMTQYWGVDPLARELYKPGTNKQYSWLAYHNTNNLFKATPKNKNAKITVEVTDRFGQKYTQTIPSK